MRAVAWIARLVTPVFGVALIAGAIVVAYPRPSAGAQPVSAAECMSMVGNVPAPAAAQAEVAVEQRALVSARGELTGRQVSFTARRGAVVTLTLPAESFISTAGGDRLVYGRHSLATGSEIRLVSLDTGCDVRLARPDGAVRSAVFDATGGVLFVHAVDARSRADGGVTRVDLAAGAAVPVLEPLVADDDRGPTFATELSWSLDGSELVAQSCGYNACLTRILDLRTGAVEVHAQHHGAVVGVTADRLFAFDADHDRPAPLLAIERAGGVVNVLAGEVFDAQLTWPGGTPLLRFETYAGWQEVRP